MVGWRIGGACGLLVVFACEGKTVTPEDATARDTAMAEEPSPPMPTDDTAQAETPPDDDTAAPEPASDDTERFDPPPTQAELEAWNRPDPLTEKTFNKWDEAHLPQLLDYAVDIQCFRHHIVAAGRAHLDGSISEAQWVELRRDHVRTTDGWVKRLFAEQPRIIERSKLVAYLLEAHDQVTFGYPKALEEGGVTLDEAEALWMIVQAKIRGYVTKLGGTYVELSADECERRPGRGI